jgi:glycosyltransferase involved in cell wall biosynthesis
MKILHVISSIDSIYGGPSKYILDLVSSQNNMGVNGYICTTHEKNYKIKISSNYKFIKDKIFSFRVNLLKSLRFSSGFKKFIDNNIHTYDIIHIHGLYRFPTSYAAYKARALKLPYVIRPHGSLDPYLYKRSAYSLNLKKLWEFFVDFPNIRNASGIHCTSNLEKNKINQLNIGHKIKLFIVPNFVSKFFFKKKKINLSFKKKIGLSQKDKIILFLGRINFKKGLDLLIPAFKKINNVFTNYKLLVVGPNNDKYLEKVVLPLVKQNELEHLFKYLPAIYGNELLQCYQECDLFVLPSYSENFGLTIFEAMASKIPVVVSDQIDLASKIKKNKLAFVHKCNVNSLFRQIKFCIEDKYLANQNKRRAYNFVKENFTSKLGVINLNKIYKKILSDHKGLN